MGALEIIGIALGSSVLTSLIQAIASRRKEKDDSKETYADRLERRVRILEERQEILEIRGNIQAASINCAWACRNRTATEPCPVIQHMESNPMPKFNKKEEEQ